MTNVPVLRAICLASIVLLPALTAQGSEVPRETPQQTQDLETLVAAASQHGIDSRESYEAHLQIFQRYAEAGRSHEAFEVGRLSVGRHPVATVPRHLLAWFLMERKFLRRAEAVLAPLQERKVLDAASGATWVTLAHRAFDGEAVLARASEVPESPAVTWMVQHHRELAADRSTARTRQVVALIVGLLLLAAVPGWLLWRRRGAARDGEAAAEA